MKFAISRVTELDCYTKFLISLLCILTVHQFPIARGTKGGHVSSSRGSITSASSGIPAKVSTSVPTFFAHSPEFEPCCTCGAEEGLVDVNSEQNPREYASRDSQPVKYKTYSVKPTSRNGGTQTTHSSSRTRVKASEPLQPCTASSSHVTRQERLKETYMIPLSRVFQEPSISSTSA